MSQLGELIAGLIPENLLDLMGNKEVRENLERIVRHAEKLEHLGRDGKREYVAHEFDALIEREIGKVLPRRVVELLLNLVLVKVKGAG